MSVFIRADRNTPPPKDAILLRSDQLCGFYERVVETWKPQHDIWALTYGPKILGVAGSLSGMYGSMYFRRKLKLNTKGYGAVTTYLPNLILPFLLAQSAHLLASIVDLSLISHESTALKQIINKNDSIFPHTFLAGNQWHLHKSIGLFGVQGDASRCPSSELWIITTDGIGTRISVYVCNQTFHIPSAITTHTHQRFHKNLQTIIPAIESSNDH